MALGEVVHRTDVSWCVFARDIVTDQSHSSLKEHVVTAGVGGGGVSYTVVILMQVPWAMTGIPDAAMEEQWGGGKLTQRKSLTWQLHLSFRH